MSAKYKVKASADSIQILRGKKEVLYWDKQEWIDDPDVVFAILEATLMASTDPEMMDIKLREAGVIK